MRFEFATAGRILFGAGRLAELGAAARELGERALVVTGRNPARVQGVIDRLHAAGVATAVYTVAGEPTVDDALRGVEAAHAHRADLVVAVGGGSAIDAGKAIAALATNRGDIFDYLEVIGRGQPLTVPSLPVIAVPTTAGTGSEVTRNAVLASPAHQVKVSVRSASMLPRVALVDPELTYGLPPDATAYTGMDALTQLIEPLVSARANPLTDGFCREGLPRAARSLRRAYENGGDAEARADMAMASLCGGLALANAGLGAVHGFAGPFGGMYGAPHGAVCAALVAPVLAANVAALQARQPHGPALARCREVAVLLTGDPAATPADGVAWLEELAAALHIPGLAAYGFGLADAPALIAKAQAASSMKANPLPLTDAELQAVLERGL